MPMRIWWRMGVAAAIGVFAWGCPATLPPEVSIEHQLRFVVPSFYREAVGIGGVAVLPFLGGAGPEGIRNDAAFELAQAYRRAFPRATIVTREELMRTLRPSGLDKAVTRLVTGYEATQKLDPGALLRLQQDVSVRYLAYGRLERFSERDAAGMRRKEVELYTELWDVTCRQVVWAGSGSHRVAESLQQTGTPMGDLFVGAATEAVAAVGPSVGKKVTNAPSC
jgi:hypothetical protein